MIISKTKWKGYVLLFAFYTSAVILFCGCNATVIEGKVLDIKGEALPGVTVSVQGAATQALTNALGAYKLRVAPGHWMLFFHKSGYTPGRFEIDAEAPGIIEARPVTLWCLPPGNGVFLYEEYRYRATRAIERETFLAQDGRMLYGTVKFDPEHPDSAATNNATPILLCYNMPRSGVCLHRLERTDVVLEDARNGTSVKIWTPVESFPVSLISIDEPEGLLQQVQLDTNLQPGVYAVNWGAFDTSAGADPRIYLFSVRTPQDKGLEKTRDTPTAQKENGSNNPAQENTKAKQKTESPKNVTDKAPSDQSQTKQPKVKDEIDLIEPVLHDL